MNPLTTTPGGPAAVRVLGPVHLRAGGEPVAVHAPKVRSLLALLTMRVGQVVSTERLEDELWDGSPPRAAATAVRVHVANLRRLLAAHAPALAVEHRAPGYVLAVDADLVDAARAERLLKEAVRAPLTDQLALADEALALWDGVPYADVALLCVDAERRRLDELRLDVLELRAGARARVAPPDAAFVADLKGLIELAPRRERFTELLMLALYRSGREPAALDEFQRFRRCLAEELGLLPSRALQELEQAILRQREDLAWRPPGSGVARVPGPAPVAAAPAARRAYTGPFVGRAEELAFLRRAWDGGERRGNVLVLGEAGIGKSRLAAELAGPLRGEGVTVVVGTCDPDQSIAFRPFVEILRLLQAPGAGGPVEPPSGPSGETDRLRFFTGVCELLERQAAANPAGLLVVVEDLQWVDQASAALVRFLLNADPPLPVFTLSTARTDEPEESMAWSRLRAELVRRDAPARSLVLGGLGADDVGALLGPAAPGAGPDAATAARVCRLTGGNPLLIGELLAAPADGAGPAVGPGELTVPATVAETVRHRLRLMSRPARRSLEIAAVAGDRADAELVAVAAGVPTHELYAHRAEAVELHVLVEDDDDPAAVVFKHSLVRRAVLGAMPTSRRRHLHVAWALALSRRAPAGTERDLAVAGHLLDGVPAHPAVEAAAAVAAVADRAIAAHAFEQAESLTRRALDGGGDGLPDDVAFALLVARGAALGHLGRAPEAGVSLTRAAEVARRLDDSHRLAVAALGGDLPDRPLNTAPWRARLLPEALDGLDGHRCALRVRVMAALARDAATPGEFVDRSDLAAQAVDLARELGDPRELFDALSAWHTQRLGRPGPDTLGVTDELVRLSELTGDVGWTRARARLTRARERLGAGDMPGAEADLAVHRALAERTSRPRDRWQALVVQATLARLRGELDAAEEPAAEAAAYGGRLELPEAGLAYGVHLYLLNLHRGDLSDLVPVIEQFAADNPGLPQLRLAAALAAVDTGGTPAPGTVAAIVARRPPDELLPALLALGTLLAVATDEHDVLDVLDRGLEPFASSFLIIGGLTGTLGPADRYRAMLARRRGQVDRALRLAHAAVGLADAMGATTWSLWCQAEVAAAQAEVDLTAAHQLAETVAERARLVGLGGPAAAADRVRAAVGQARSRPPRDLPRSHPG